MAVWLAERTLRIKTSHHRRQWGYYINGRGSGRFQDGPKPNWRIMTWKDKVYVPEKASSAVGRPTWKRMTILSTPSSTPQLVIDVELSLPPPACTMVQEFLYLFLPNPSPTCSNFPGNFSLTDTHSNINGWPTSSPDQCRVTIPCCVSWSLFLCVSRGYLLFQPQMIRIFFFFHFILTNKLRGR